MQKLKISHSVKKGILYIFLLSLLFLYSCRSKKPNPLSEASSPYLREHADNPVDWHEWGDEALQIAKKENKPLLISIGYSSCHWCHMMEKESFMDTGVARIMNENFICIIVDKEERPDIDNVYTNACQLISGNSGWPLNAFALPDGKPFFAGTYYSKQSWINLLKQVVTAYKTQQGKVNLQAQTLSNGISNLEFSALTDSTTDIASKAKYQALFENLYLKMDHSFGGLRGSPKFPIPASIEFLLQYYFLYKDKRALNAATTTLTEMALGGIYDQLGGGFARYSVDSLWHVPHFEKMLYDNAQLLSVYSHAYQLTGNDFFKTIVQETISFFQRDLRNSNGGYFSSLNADTRDGEGKFYTWSSGELKAKLLSNYKQVADYYNINEDGNWKVNENILFALETPALFAQKNSIHPDIFSKQLEGAKQILLSERNRREKPSADNKILTSWNALLMTGYLDAYAALGNEIYLQNALATGRFLENKMIQKDGKLLRSFTNGQPSINGFLDDYALLAKAYIRLYQLTFDKHWLVCSQQLADYAIKNFYNPGSGMFFYTANQSETSVIRKIEITDNSIPSSNASMAEVLYFLSVYFDNEDYLAKSTLMISKVYDQLRKEGTNFYASWCLLAGLFSYGTNEVAIVGKDALIKNLDLQKNYLPLSVFLGSTKDENLALLKGKMSDTRTLIYVCTNKTCKRPVEEVQNALNQLTK